MYDASPWEVSSLNLLMVLALPLSFLSLIRPEVVYVITIIVSTIIVSGCYSAAEASTFVQADGLAHLHRTAANMKRTWFALNNELYILLYLYA